MPCQVFPRVNSLYIYGTFYHGAMESMHQHEIYVVPTSLRPLSKILREEEDDAFTVSRRFDIVWKIAERAFAAEWDYWEGMDTNTRYSAQFKGDVYLFDKFHPSDGQGTVKKCFILKIEAKDPTVHPGLFHSLQPEDVKQEEVFIEDVELISTQRFQDCETQLKEIKENLQTGHENIFHSVKA